MSVENNDNGARAAGDVFGYLVCRCRMHQVPKYLGIHAVDIRLPQKAPQCPLRHQEVENVRVRQKYCMLFMINKSVLLYLTQVHAVKPRALLALLIALHPFPNPFGVLDSLSNLTRT